MLIDARATLDRVNSARLYRLVATAIIYMLSSAALVILWKMPEQATSLGIEDGPAENLTALFLLVASIAMAIHAAKLILNNQSRQLATLALLASIAFFVFAGEEISWGQRILGIETNEFMQEYNWQGEMNFHNLHTDLFNVAFHYGALVFLVILPLFRTEVLSFFTRYRLDILRHFVAPTWLAVPSFAIFGMLDPRFIYAIETPWAAAAYLLALAATVALLCYQLFAAINTQAFSRAGLLALSLALIALGLFVSYLQAVDNEPNTISEYKELVIAAELLIFALRWSTASANNP